MQSIQFIFCLHDHQPVGNFDHVFAECYDRAYQPFLEMLEAYPGFRACLHHTGPLLEWIEANRPKYLTRLRKLVDAGQVELLGGAFYEPILPVIPHGDRVAQINLMSDWLERVFGVRPRGMWLAERVWEPTLPASIRAAGIEYTVLDDMHFRSVGVSEEGSFGYYLTEEQGHAIAVFPINEHVRHRIPYAEPPETLEYLKKHSHETLARTVIMADDGEKFGAWPDSYRHCYQEGWFYRFAEQITNNSEWLRMKTFSEVLDETAPMGRIYLPTASYIEMSEWALPAQTLSEYHKVIEGLKKGDDYDRVRLFVRGGFWRSFFAKYDEANHIHKKMLGVSAKLHAVPEEKRPSRDFLIAQDQLLRAQCNCAYWHGVFGGLYLTNLRFALYRHLITAEAIVDGLTHSGKSWSEVRVLDFDVDGEPEVIVESHAQAIVFKPNMGGAIFEHDLRPEALNIADTLMRRREQYHDAILGGDEVRMRNPNTRVDDALVIDWYRHGSYIDHFLGDDVTPEAMRRAAYSETGDFVAQPYELRWKRGRGRVIVDLSREAEVQAADGPRLVEVTKSLSIESGEGAIKAAYRVTNKSSEPLETRFGVEFIANFLAGSAPDRFHRIGPVNLGEGNVLASIGAVEGISDFSIVDLWLDLALDWTLSKPAAHWRFPIETASNSVEGVERVYQGTVVIPVWRLRLGAGESWEVTIDWKTRRPRLSD